MHRIFLVLLTMMMAACTAFQAVDGSSSEIQQRIAVGELLRPGDEVRVFTLDGSVHEFRVTQVDVRGGNLLGETESIPFAEIRAIEKREFDLGTTARRTGIGVLVFAAANAWFCC
jgi:hypothetical protein